MRLELEGWMQLNLQGTLWEATQDVCSSSPSLDLQLQPREPPGIAVLCDVLAGDTVLVPPSRLD